MLWGMGARWTMLWPDFFWMCWLPEAQSDYCEPCSWKSCGTWSRDNESPLDTDGERQCASQMQSWTPCLACQKTSALSQCCHWWRRSSLGNRRWIRKKALWVWVHIPSPRWGPEASPVRKYLAVCSESSWWHPLDYWSGWVWRPPCFEQRFGSWPWPNSTWCLQVCLGSGFEVPL